VIDFHCHVDLYPEPEALVERLRELRHYVLAVTTTPRAWDGTCALVAGAPRLRVGLGLHPELVATRHHEVELLCSLIEQARYVGEVGLDGSPPHRGSLELQRQVFDRILDACAEAGGRILSIHSRGAATAVLDALEAHPGCGTPILHWFSGRERELARAVALGCWFSVGPPMLGSAKGRTLVAKMPRDRVLTETDGPFSRRGAEPLEPADLVQAIAGLAALWGESEEEAAKAIAGNLRRLVTHEVASPA
jgi:TatD DNase family protein